MTSFRGDLGAPIRSRLMFAARKMFERLVGAGQEAMNDFLGPMPHAGGGAKAAFSAVPTSYAHPPPLIVLRNMKGPTLHFGRRGWNRGSGLRGVRALWSERKECDGPAFRCRMGYIKYGNGMFDGQGSGHDFYGVLPDAPHIQPCWKHPLDCPPR